MLDPIPPPPQWLQDAFRPLLEKLYLHSMTLHIHEIIISLVFYQFVQSVLSPWLSTALFPKIYPNFNRRTKLNWDVHVVSLVQSSLINAVALWVMVADKERWNMTSAERVFGYSGTCGLIQAMAVGYFVWDLIVSTRYIKLFGIGLWFHAVSALWVFSLGFRPFVNYYGPTFILYELSSPFLNFHWFFDKVNMTGSNAQWYNGMALLAVFFSCRLVWGTWQSVRVFIDIFGAYRQSTGAALESFNIYSLLQDTNHAACTTEACTLAREQVSHFAGFHAGGIPFWLVLTYLGSNFILNSLNFYWFSKMIEAVMKRFTKPAPGVEEKTKLEKPDSHDVVLEAAATLEEEERVFINGGMPEEVNGKSVMATSSTATAPSSTRRRKA